VERRWKYAVYYDVYTGKGPEYEMYDLLEGPLERRNLAHHRAVVSESVAAERQRLHRRLTQVMEQLGTTPENIAWPRISGSTEFVRTEEPDPVINPAKHQAD
jgi:hypothetical protein